MRLLQVNLVYLCVQRVALPLHSFSWPCLCTQLHPISQPLTAWLKRRAQIVPRRDTLQGLAQTRISVTEPPWLESQEDRKAAEPADGVRRE